MSNTNLALALLALVFSIPSCDGYAVKTVSKVNVETSSISTLPDCSDLDSVMVVNIERTGLKHLYPDFYQKNKNRFSYVSDENGKVDVDEFKFVEYGMINKVRYHSINGEYLIIERYVMMDSTIKKRSNPSVYDSVDLIEYYYLTDECCLKEQLSKKCANMGGMSVNDGPCKARIDKMKELLAIDQ